MYTLKTKKKENKPGTWNSVICEIYKGEEKIGEYERYYPSYSNETFAPFTFKGKDYALYSSNYTTISLMSLPDCKKIKLKEECIKQLNNFCPVEILVPKFVDVKYNHHKEKEFERYTWNESYEEASDKFKVINTGFSTLALALGCVWGDDSSWKLNLIDLRKIDEGELWYINNLGEKQWLYEEFPDSVSLENISLEFDNNDSFPCGYKQLKQEWHFFNNEIKPLKEINETNK